MWSSTACHKFGLCENKKIKIITHKILLMKLKWKLKWEQIGVENINVMSALKLKFTFILSKWIKKKC